MLSDSSIKNLKRFPSLIFKKEIPTHSDKKETQLSVVTSLLNDLFDEVFEIICHRKIKNNCSTVFALQLKKTIETVFRINCLKSMYPVPSSLSLTQSSHETEPKIMNIDNYHHKAVLTIKIHRKSKLPDTLRNSARFKSKQRGVDQIRINQFNFKNKSQESKESGESSVINLNSGTINSSSVHPGLPQRYQPPKMSKRSLIGSKLETIREGKMMETLIHMNQEKEYNSFLKKKNLDVVQTNQASSSTLNTNQNGKVKKKESKSVRICDVVHYPRCELTNKTVSRLFFEEPNFASTYRDYGKKNKVIKNMKEGFSEPENKSSKSVLRTVAIPKKDGIVYQYPNILIDELVNKFEPENGVKFTIEHFGKKEKQQKPENRFKMLKSTFSKKFV